MIAALVLAAGYSSRMGRFKPLVPIGGATALERVIDLFRAAGINELTVVTGYNAELMRAVLEGKQVHHAYNAGYDAGMYSSVVTGVRSLAGDVEACFILPADMPLVRPRTVQLLAQAHENHPRAVIYPVFQGRRGHPPLIGRSVLAESLHSEESGSLRTLLARHQQCAGEVAVIDEGIHLDLDTPADLALAETLAECSDAPSLGECEAILAGERVEDNIMRRSRSVAEAARKLAVSLLRCGVALDLAVVRAACLLRESGNACVEFPKVADIIGRHPDFDRSGRLDEAAIVHLAVTLEAGGTILSIEREIEQRSGMRLAQILESL